MYPISAANPPSTPSMKEEKKSIEMERRRGGTSISSADGDKCWWSFDQVESFYRECYIGREEVPFSGVSLAFKVSPSECCVASDIS